MSQISKHEVIEQLIKAASEVFAQKGYEKATIDEIVEIAGYSKGAFYYYYNSKEDLFLDIVDFRVAAQEKLLQEIIDPEQTLFANVNRLLEQYLQYTAKDQWVLIYIEFLAQAGRKDKVKERMVRKYRNQLSFLQAYICKGKELKLIPEGIDVEITAGLIGAVIDGYNVRSIVEPDPIPVKELAEAIICFFKRSKK